MDTELMNALRKAEKWLKKACDRSVNMPYEKMEALVLMGKAKLFLHEDCAYVAFPTNLNKERTLNLLSAGGNLQSLVGYLPEAEEYARQEECKSLMVFGRKGWAKKLPGFKEQTRLIKRDLSWVA